MSTDTATPVGTPQLIDLELITPDEVALRDEVDKESQVWADFVQSIKNNGIMTALLVRPDPDDEDRFLIVDGLHRFTAALDLGLDQVPCIVREDIQPSDVMQLQIQANVHKVETRPVQYAEQLRRIMAENPLLTQQDLARMCAKDQSWISKVLRLNTLTDEAKALVDGGQICSSNAFKLARLPREEQNEFLDRAQTMSPNDFLPLIDTYHRELLKRSRGIKSETGFEPNAKIRSKASILNQIGQVFEEQIKRLGQDVLEDAANNQNTPAAILGYYNGLRWAASLDDDSVEAARQAYEERQAESIRKKEEKERQKMAEESASKGIDTLIKGKDTALPKGLHSAE